MTPAVAPCAEEKFFSASIPVITVADSYRRITEHGSTIVPRSELRIVQTPQVFRADILRSAYNVEFDASFTDDASVVEAFGHSISLVEGDARNIKLTTPNDLAYAEWLIDSDNR
jgi:2-C-methyl-D-erythritol 4-phosphate cytidylyltransferase